MNFQILQKQIQFTHHQLYLSTIKSVNTHLSLRNWLIGYYIIEFEQKGKDKAKYGTNLIKELSKNIKIKGLGETNLKQCRKFFMIYPEISQSLTDLFKNEDINLKSTLNQIATNTTFTNKNQLLEKKRNFLTLDCNY